MPLAAITIFFPPMALYPQKTQSRATRTLSRVPTFVDMQAHDQTLLPDRSTKDSMVSAIP